MAENSMADARSYVVRGKLYRWVDFFYHSSQSQLRQSRVEIIRHYSLTSTVPVPVGSTLLSRNDLGLIDLAFSFHESFFFLFSQCPKLLIKPSSNKNSKPKVFRRKVLKKQKQSSFSESMAVETEKPSAPPHGFLNIGSQSPQYLPLDNGHQQVAPVVSAPNHTIIHVGGFGGGCPSCRVGVLRKSHCTFCGVLWSILLFPCGLLCLCCCTKDRCSNCSYTQN